MATAEDAAAVVAATVVDAAGVVAATVVDAAAVAVATAVAVADEAVIEVAGTDTDDRARMLTSANPYERLLTRPAERGGRERARWGAGASMDNHIDGQAH